MPLLVNGVNAGKTAFQIMKNDENKEIGELIQEITEKGFERIEIDVDDSSDERSVTVSAASYAQGVDANAWSTADSLTEALQSVVNYLRAKAGEPSLDEELAKMLADDQATDALPLEFGNPIARCVSCGHSWHFRVERKGRCSIDPHSGHVAPACTPDRLAFGEIFTCTNCGQHYTTHQ